MATMGARDIIIPTQRFANTDCNRLLADIKMSEPWHLGAEIELIHLFLEEPDLQHLAVEVEPALVAKLGVLGISRLGCLRFGHLITVQLE
jgi:hypothetical protein